MKKDFRSSYRLKPSPNRPDHTIDVSDVVTKYNELPIRRTLDPQSPSYKLPSFADVPFEQKKSVRDLQLNITDIDGTSPKKLFTNSNLHRPPKERNTNLDITDMIQKTQPKLHPRSPDYNMLKVDDISGPQKNFVRVKIHEATLIQNDEQKRFTRNLMNTNDIDGLLKEKQKKFEKKYGGQKSIHDVTMTDDICYPNQREPRPRTTDFLKSPTKFSSDAIGQEHDECSPYKKQFSVYEKTFPEFTDKLELPFVKKVENPPAFKIPEIVTISLDSIKTDTNKYAGKDTELLQKYVKRHQTVGFLPGPPPEQYKHDNDFARKKQDNVGSMWQEVHRIRNAVPDQLIRDITQKNSPTRSLNNPLISLTAARSQKETVTLKPKSGQSDIRIRYADRKEEHRIQTRREAVRAVEDLPW